jgi:flagellar biogenesis protein FliO
MESPEKMRPMALPQSTLARIEIMPRPARWNSPRFFALAATGLKLLWRSIISNAGKKRKALSVRETAALGDRRFVSVIQFESQRFLIGSSPASVTLLAQLPDQPPPDQEAGKQARAESNAETDAETNERWGQQSKTEETQKESAERN